MAEETFLEKFNKKTDSLNIGNTGQDLCDIVKILSALGFKEERIHKVIVTYLEHPHLPLTH